MTLKAVSTKSHLLPGHSVVSVRSRVTAISPTKVTGGLIEDRAYAAAVWLSLDAFSVLKLATQ